MFLYSVWLQLSTTTKIKLAKEFNISKTGSTHVVNNEVQNDGFLLKDIEGAITRTSLQKYLNVPEEDMTTLWNMLINKIEGKVEETPLVLSSNIITPFNYSADNLPQSPSALAVPETPVRKKRGRPKKIK